MASSNDHSKPYHTVHSRMERVPCRSKLNNLSHGLEFHWFHGREQFTSSDNFSDRVLPRSSFDWYIFIWHNNQDKCAYQVNLSLLVSAILYWVRLLVSRTATHIENQRTNQIAKSKPNGLLRWGNSRWRLNTSIKFEFFNFGNISIKTGWRECIVCRT